MTRKRRSFSPEFKSEAASLLLDECYSAPQAGMSIGVAENVLSCWVRQLAEEREVVTPRGKALTLEQRRIQEPEARCNRLEREKEILKKATALLMSDEMNRTH